MRDYNNLINPEGLGQVGYFKPTLPDESLKISNPEFYKQVIKRYEQRLAEYDELFEKVESLKQKGQYRVENGVVIDPKNDLGVTGDYDIFDILTLDGQRVEKGTKKWIAVMSDLEKEPVAVQHGFHMEWEPKDPFGKRIKQKIVDGHKQGLNGERLADFYPDGSVEHKFYTE